MIGKEFAENKAEWEDKIQALLTDRRNHLEKLLAAYRRNYKNLQSIEFTEQQLAVATAEYGDFLDGHLLWIRSSRIFRPTDLRNLPRVIMWLTSPYNWGQLLRDSADSFDRNPFIFILGILFGVTLFIGRKRAQQNISKLAESVGQLDAILLW